MQGIADCMHDEVERSREVYTWRQASLHTRSQEGVYTMRKTSLQVLMNAFTHGGKRAYTQRQMHLHAEVNEIARGFK